jgi:hypothetical protein
MGSCCNRSITPAAGSYRAAGLLVDVDKATGKCCVVESDEHRKSSPRVTYSPLPLPLLTYVHCLTEVVSSIAQRELEPELFTTT